MRSILVTGGSGQLGTALARFAWPAGWEAVTVDRATLDLEDMDGIAKLIASRPWAAIVNAAAYTAVDQAESDVVTCWTVNALAPAALAAAAHARDIPIVQLSTDYVFDGGGGRPWQVDDPTRPINVYGASKLAGELAVRTAATRHAIIRTAWLMGETGRNFLRTMLRLAETRDRIDVVSDQIGTPTMAPDLAAAVATVAMRLAEDRQAPAGTWHFANSGPASWHDLAVAIFGGASWRGGPFAEVNGIDTADYPTAARRPLHSVLDTSAIERVFGIRPRPWQEALEDVLDEIFGKGSA